MSSNPAPNTPFQAPSTKWIARYQRWWASHVLHRIPSTRRQRIVRYAKASLAYHGRMVYTEGPQRSDLFYRKPGHFLGAHADCSQYSASLCHWVGVWNVNDTDWTGTLGKKGKQLEQPIHGCFVFFGSPPYVHMAVMVDRSHAIGFGDQQAPDQATLAGLLAYFQSAGHPGHAFRDLTA